MSKIKNERPKRKTRLSRSSLRTAANTKAWPVTSRSTNGAGAQTKIKTEAMLKPGFGWWRFLPGLFLVILVVVAWSISNSSNNSSSVTADRATSSVQAQYYVEATVATGRNVATATIITPTALLDISSSMATTNPNPLKSASPTPAMAITNPTKAKSAPVILNASGYMVMVKEARVLFDQTSATSQLAVLISLGGNYYLPKEIYGATVSLLDQRSGRIYQSGNLIGGGAELIPVLDLMSRKSALRFGEQVSGWVSFAIEGNDGAGGNGDQLPSSLEPYRLQFEPPYPQGGDDSERLLSLRLPG